MPGARECCAAAYAEDREESVAPCSYAAISARPTECLNQCFQSRCTIL